MSSEINNDESISKPLSVKSIMKLAVLAIMILFVINNWSLFRGKPAHPYMRFSLPIFGEKNSDGVMAVVDTDMSRCIILDKDGRYRGHINASASLSAKTVSMFSDIALTQERLYVLDEMSSDGKVSHKAVRIMEFDLNGNYLSTLFQQEYTPETQELSSSIFTDGEKLFCQTILKNVFKCYRLEDGAMKELVSWVPTDVRLWESAFCISNNNLFACAYDGKSYISRDGGKTTTPMNLLGRRQHLKSLVYNNRNELFVLDGNANGIFQVGSDGSVKEITKTSALWISHCGDELVYCDVATNSLVIFNPYTNERRSYTTAPYPISLCIKHISFVLDVIVLLILAIVMLIKCIIQCVKNIRRNNEALKKENENGETLSLFTLYGQNAFSFIMAYLIALLLILPTYYHTSIKKNTEVLQAMAKQVSLTSELHLGKFLSELGNVQALNSEPMKNILKFCEQLKHPSRKSSGFMLEYALFKILDNTHSVLIDTSVNGDYIGAIQTNDGKINAELGNAYPKLLSGEIVTIDGTSKFNPGSFYITLAPLFDSKQNVVGIFATFYNKQWVQSAILNKLTMLAIDLFILYIAAIFFIGEAMLCWRFYKLHQNNIAMGLKNKTVPEIHRTLNFMIALTANICFVFTPVLSMNLAKANGMTENLNLWAALPLTLCMVFISLGMLINGIFVKRNPRLYYLMGEGLEGIVTPIICIYAVLQNSYWIFLGSIAASGFCHTMSLSAANALAGAELPMDKRYRHLVHTYVEYAVGTAIATALGSFLYTKFGPIVPYAAAVICAGLQVPIICTMVNSDINVKNNQTEQKKNTKEKISFRTYLRAFCTPKVLCFSFLVLFASGFYTSFQEYLFPVYLEFTGNSLQYAGLTSAICTIVTTIVISSYLSQQPNFGKNSMLGVMQLLLGGWTLLMVFNANIFSFFMIIFILQLLTSVIHVNTLQTFIPYAKQHNVPYSAITGCFALVEFLGCSSGPFILGLLFAKSIGMVGLVCGSALIAAAIFYQSFTKITAVKKGNV